jgi:putative holliday junction resolvase
MITRNPHDLPKGRILALDGGAVRVGLAVSDTAQRLAGAVGIVPRKPWAGIQTALESWKAQGVTACVVGLPLNMDGTEGPACNAARSLADLIDKNCGLPVLLWDERLTSQQAEAAFFEQRTGRQTRGSKKESVGKVDSAAAVLLLQGVLDSFKLSDPFR